MHEIKFYTTIQLILVYILLFEAAEQNALLKRRKRETKINEQDNIIVFMNALLLNYPLFM